MIGWYDACDALIGDFAHHIHPRGRGWSSNLNFAQDALGVIDVLEGFLDLFNSDCFLRFFIFGLKSRRVGMRVRVRVTVRVRVGFRVRMRVRVRDRVRVRFRAKVRVISAF